MRFYGYICESFYDDVKCKCLDDVFVTLVCVFLDMIMHDVKVVCFLYAILNVSV